MGEFSTFQVQAGKDAGKWRCAARVADQFGRKKTKVVQRPTKAAAEKEMRNWLREHGRLVPSPLMSVDAMCEAYIARCEKLDRAEKTIAEYRKLHELLKEPIGHIPINELTPDHVEEMLSTIGGDTGKLRVNVRAFLRAAINRIGKKADTSMPNVAAIAEPPAYTPENSVPLSLEGFAEILEKETDHVLRTLWLFLGETGLRPSEARNLLWTELSEREDGMWVQLLHSKTREGKKPVPVQSAAAETIRSLPRISLFVFAQSEGRGRGKPFDESNLREAWRDAVARTKQPMTNLYQLRHLFGTKHARTADDATLKRLMRHTDIRTTKSYYVDPFPSDLRKAVDGK